MNHMVKLETVQDKIIDIRGEKVILDSDVAALYGVETKRVNEAVKNNQDKFPEGYIFDLNKNEWDGLKSKFSTSIKGGKVKLPTAFTEKGLYMLATIIKSPRAVQTTLDIIETYAKIRDLSRSMSRLPTADKAEQKSIMEKAGDILGDILDGALETTGSETTLELNLAVIKVKHTVKKGKK
ncbi:MAG: ORF6N domain-containing protein [Deltaproteobacteria bacterium]|nr:ORF6N domain-containing protein [Deltaproteobacteria bacterium]